MAKIRTISDSRQTSDVFKGLTAEQHDVVVKHGLRKKLPPKKILFHQGNSAQSCFLVNRGRLKRTKLNAQGREVIFCYIGAGELTAAVAVLNIRTIHIKEEHHVLFSMSGNRQEHRLHRKRCLW